MTALLIPLGLIYFIQMLFVVMALASNEDNDFYDSKLEVILWCIPIIPIIYGLLRVIKKLFSNFMDL